MVDIDYGKKTPQEVKATFRKQMEIAKKLSKELHQSDEFQLVESNNGVNALKRETKKGEKIPFVKLEVEFETDMTPVQVVDYIWKVQSEDETREKISEFVATSTVVADLEDESKTTFEKLNADVKLPKAWEIAVVLTKVPARFVSAREFLFQREKWVEQDGKICWVVSESIDHPKYPTYSGFVMGKLFNTWHLEQKVDDNGKKSVIGNYIVQNDPSGWLPSWLVKQSVLTQPFLFVQNLKTYVEAK